MHHRPLKNLLVGLLVFLVGSSFAASVSAQSTSTLTRIALFEPIGQSKDPTLAAVLSTVADSVELSLVVLQRYEVRRLPPADPAQDLPRVRAYCEANHIDQAILGSGSERSEGGFAFRLLVYDRRSDSITLDRQGSSSGALDMFDTTDTLVASLLDGLSGTHLLFGSLTVDTDPPGATVSVNGRDAGQGPISLRGLPVGTVQLVARASGREDAQASVAITDGETASVSLKLARSMGKLAVQMPSDGQLTVSSTEIGQKQIAGPGGLDLPTGDYQVQATSPGLANVTGQITVGRNATASWLPWTRGYLVVQTVPEGSAITVDGAARGTAPQVVEVDPGVLHRVQVTKDKYDTYVADLSSAAGVKTFMAPELAGLPGAVSVSTSIPGASVELDDGSWQQTPFVFKDVPAGTHTVKIESVRNGDGLFTAGPPFQVVVSPAEETDVAKEMIRGKGRLTVTDAPPGSAVQINGGDVDSVQALTNGIELLAGVIHVSVTTHLVPDRVSSPITGQWTGDLYVQPDSDVHDSIYDLAWLIPRRTISLDAGSDQWAGLLAEWNKGFYGPFIRSQPGSFVSGGYASQDGKWLYVRFDFSDGTPTATLSRDVKQVLSYGILIYTNHNQSDRVTVGIRFSQNGPISTNFGIWNEGKRVWTDFGAGQVSYHIGPNSLQVKVPLDFIKPYVAGLSTMSLQMDMEDYNGQWGPWVETTKRRITFGF